MIPKRKQWKQENQKFEVCLLHTKYEASLTYIRFCLSVPPSLKMCIVKLYSSVIGCFPSLCEELGSTFSFATKAHHPLMLYTTSSLFTYALVVLKYFNKIYEYFLQL